MRLFVAAKRRTLRRKTALCEKVEELAKQENKSAADWEKRTKEIIGIQQEWKGIGFAPQKMNVKIFERFRAACDEFFSRKGEFFKEMKAQFAENTEKRRRLLRKHKPLPTLQNGKQHQISSLLCKKNEDYRHGS